MSGEIRIKTSWLLLVGAIAAAIGGAVLASVAPDIKRELRIMRM